MRKTKITNNRSFGGRSSVRSFIRSSSTLARAHQVAACSSISTDFF
jgi:hypothetical protein